MNDNTFLKLFLEIIRDHPHKSGEWKWNEFVKRIRAMQDKELCEQCGTRMHMYYICRECGQIKGEENANTNNN